MPPADTSQPLARAATVRPAPAPAGCGGIAAIRDGLRKALGGLSPCRSIPFSPFGFYAEITKAVTTPEGDWVVEGPLSDPSQDIQGEAIDQGQWGRSGLRKGLATFKALGGVVDWEHLYEKTRDPAAIVGQGIELFDAPHPVTKAIVPWLRVKLFKAKALAQKIWEHLQAGGTLGFSVAGAAIRKAGARILDTIITTVGITAVPVQSANAGCLRIVKALDYYGDYSGDLADLRLPVPAELKAEILPLFRALSASPALPHVGPGCSALMTEDLGGQGGSHGARGRKKKGQATLANADALPEADLPEMPSLDDAVRPEEDEVVRRQTLKRRGTLVRKAIAYELSEALSSRLTA